MKLELRCSRMSSFPAHHHLDDCFHLTENKVRNWKPYIYCRIGLMVLEYNYSLVSDLNPGLIRVCQPPTLTIHPPQEEKFTHACKTVKTCTKIGSQIYLLAPSSWPHFTTKKNVVQD